MTWCGQTHLGFQPATGAKYENQFWCADRRPKGQDCYKRFELLGFTGKMGGVEGRCVHFFNDLDETPADKPVQKICKAQSQVWALTPSRKGGNCCPTIFSPPHS